MKYYLADFLDDDINSVLTKNSIDTTKIEINLLEPAIPIHDIPKLIGIYVWGEAYVNDELSNKKSITISFLAPEYKRRFVIAHKFAHILYKHFEVKDKISKDKTLTIKEKEFLYKAIERQANNFAFNLLLPTKLVREVDKLHKGDFSNNKRRIIELAELFGVQDRFMELRLKDIDN